MHEYSILVVEDEHTLRRLLEYRLSKQYRVRTAGHGEEALVRIAEEIPDLIVSDIMMPKMDGFTLQSSLQQDNRTRAIPFIFLTAKADEQSRAKGLRTGVDDYITKPFDIDQLLVRIGNLLARAKIYQSTLNARIGQDFSQRLMPKKLPQVPGYQVHFYSDPREDGGGDLFDWMELPSGSHLFTIGDVMGKGIQAKFYAFSFLSYIRATIHAVHHEKTSPAAILKRVNQLLMKDEVLEETFASLLLMRWDPALHQVTYANAGHCRPLLVSSEGISVVENSDMILGLDLNADFTDTAISLGPGSAMVAYTDGLIEQKTRTGELLGEAGAAEVVKEALGTPDPISSLLQATLHRSVSSQFSDDILVFWLGREAGA